MVTVAVAITCPPNFQWIWCVRYYTNNLICKCSCKWSWDLNIHYCVMFNFIIIILILLFIIFYYYIYLYYYYNVWNGKYHNWSVGFETDHIVKFNQIQLNSTGLTGILKFRIRITETDTAVWTFFAAPLQMLLPFVGKFFSNSLKDSFVLTGGISLTLYATCWPLLQLYEYILTTNR